MFRKVCGLALVLILLWPALAHAQHGAWEGCTLESTNSSVSRKSPSDSVKKPQKRARSRKEKKKPQHLR
ncbi:MAG TPA: hypothetical protein ENJ40_01335 [Thermosulfurimonas dismutans]|uniref:Uncharacterized protein n=1 Tax=Thermosulfurimonas dismutans TaxID=999894 RepID=A0A7C3CWK9_9BACT|nr:hypothetical protein [Thermosulfurimonas dismutans]